MIELIASNPRHKRAGARKGSTMARTKSKGRSRRRYFRRGMANTGVLKAAAGGVGGFVGASLVAGYLPATMKTNKWAAPAAMIASGLLIGLLLKRRRALAVSVGSGAIVAGAVKALSQTDFAKSFGFGDYEGYNEYNSTPLLPQIVAESPAFAGYNSYQVVGAN